MSYESQMFAGWFNNLDKLNRIEKIVNSGEEHWKIVSKIKEVLDKEKKYYVEISGELNWMLNRFAEDIEFGFITEEKLKNDGENWQSETQCYALKCFETLPEAVAYYFYVVNAEDNDVIHNIRFDNRFSDSDKGYLQNYLDDNAVSFKSFEPNEEDKEEEEEKE